MWLTAQEDTEDVQAAKDALAEYDAVGGVDLEEFFKRMVAEGRVEYDSKSNT